MGRLGAWFRSLATKARGVLPARPDPAERVTNLVEEALEEHRARNEHVAALEATRLELEGRLAQAEDERAKVDARARAAAERASAAAAVADELREAEQTAAATSFATRVPALQRVVEELTSELERATEAVKAATDDTRQLADAAARRLTEALDVLPPTDRVTMRARVDAARGVLWATSSDRTRDTTNP